MRECCVEKRIPNQGNCTTTKNFRQERAWHVQWIIRSVAAMERIRGPRQSMKSRRDVWLHKTIQAFERMLVFTVSEVGRHLEIPRSAMTQFLLFNHNWLKGGGQSLGARGVGALGWHLRQKMTVAWARVVAMGVLSSTILNLRIEPLRFTEIGCYVWEKKSDYTPKVFTPKNWEKEVLTKI